MNFQFAEHLLLRRPANTPSDHARDPQVFLSDAHFRAAVYLASPVFYATLERQDFQSQRLSERESITLKKYINRYCFRPTPFGLFASVQLCKWEAGAELTSSPAAYSAHIRPAMPVQERLTNHLLATSLRQQRLEANPTIYRVLNEYRFIRTGMAEAGTREYQLQSISFTRLLKGLVGKCAKGCTYEDIVAQIGRSAACSPEQAADYANFLIEAQFLVSALHLSITGEDQLERLAQTEVSNEFKTKLAALMAARETDAGALTPAGLRQLESQLDNLLPGTALPQEKLSVILKRTGPPPPLAEVYQEHLRDGLQALELLTPDSRPANLAGFIKSFRQHFEGQALPLLRALDPEAGIGYQLPERENSNPILETLHIPYRQQPAPSSGWSSTHALLFECWLRERSIQPVIRLQEADLEKLKKGEDAPLTGMSVLFRVIGQEVLIENAGGTNAPALLGRFTFADPTITQAAEAMAAKLEALHPEVIFAELLHLSDAHIDNINRRASCYRYELPITAASVLPADRQLALADLYVAVVDEQVILYSQKHQKRVVPRLTSAYNHSINKLPLFRFLADLGYQHGRSNLALDLRQLFPGLSFYPRVIYRQAILSLASWILNESQLTRLLSERAAAADEFNDLRRVLGLPRYFSLAEGDQELVFDADRPPDVKLFCDSVRHKKEATLKEYLEQPVVQQYNAYLLPAGPLPSLRPMPLSSFKNTPKQRKFLPGSEWLYLKLYSPKIGVNRLLTGLAPLLRGRYAGKRIRQWFFVRFDDPAPHIRLRLQLEPAAIAEVLLAFQNRLDERVQQHVIREFQVDVYSRELERYAAGGIEATEQFFCASSELVLAFLKRSRTRTRPVAAIFAICTLQRIITTFLPDAAHQLALAREGFEAFLPEFQAGSVRLALDKKYRELRPAISQALADTDPACFSGLPKAGRALDNSLQTIKNNMATGVDQAYLRSIIHLHLNRIFTDESRKQEMSCYYLLHKYLLSVQARRQNAKQS